MNFGIIIIIAIAAIWALSIFLGLIGGIFKTPPPTPAAMDSSEIQSQEQQTIDETEAKRQKMMDDIKQKMEDSGKNY